MKFVAPTVSALASGYTIAYATEPSGAGTVMAFSIGRPYPVAAIVEELAGKESVRVVASARSVLGMRGEKAIELGPRSRDR